MVTGYSADAKVQNVFRVHHIASFVEGEHSLKPEEVVKHLKALQSSRRIDETPCLMKLDHRGIRIKLEKTNETVESFEWNGIKNQAAILNPMDNFKYRYLVLFRLYQPKEKISELHVFSCETTAMAKAFVDSMSYHKNDSGKNSNESAHSTDISTRYPLRRGRSETKVNTVADAYGQHFYMLNRCIDDIESFERQLEKAIKKRANPSKSSDGTDNSRQSMPKPPTLDEFNEAVRKVKYAFNTNEAIRPYTPDRTSKKIFIRLFNTVHWLDEVCKSGCVPEYHEDMVSDVVEPLLNGDTIRAIMERLAPRKQEFWRSLGKAWNTPSEQWPNPSQRYMPQFDVPVLDEKPRRYASYEKQTSDSNLLHSPSMGNLGQPESPKIQFPEQVPSQNTVPDRSFSVTVKSPDLLERVQPVTHSVNQSVSSPMNAVEIVMEQEKPEPTPLSENISVEKTRQFSSDLADAGGELYCVTVRHVSAKQRELSVSPGSIVQVLDKSRVDWWLVRDQNGYEGEIPKWKLKPHSGSTSQTPQSAKQSSTRYSFGGFSQSGSNADANIASKRAVSTHSVMISNKGATLQRAGQSLPETDTRDASHFNATSPIAASASRQSTTTPENHVTARSISLIRSEAESNTPSAAAAASAVYAEVGNVERVISVTRRDESPVTDLQKQPPPPQQPFSNPPNTSVSTQPTVTSAALGNSMIYMTSDQLQEIMKSSENLAQVPMVLVPVAELYKYASQTNLNVGALNGTAVQQFQSQMPMQWPDLNELDNRSGSPGLTHSTGPVSDWKPAPLIPTGSMEGFGISPYPFNYPTHMHSMTRELRERLSKMREIGGTGLKAVPSPTTSNEQSVSRLTKYASKDDIAEWLVSHKFPPNAISSLKGFNGMDLYTMSRQQLAEHVGPERCDEIFYAFRGS